MEKYKRLFTGRVTYVGERLHIDYKETGRAGLAKTRDGKQVEKDFEDEVKRFFV